MFGLFKKKKEDLEFNVPSTAEIPTLEPMQPSVEEKPLTPTDSTTTEPTFESQPLDQPEEQISKDANDYIEELKQETSFDKSENELKSLDMLLPPLEEPTPTRSSMPTKNATLESLCIKIDLEVEDIQRKFKEIKAIVAKLTLNSPEIFDLLDLYNRAKDKMKSFVQEIDRFDAVGWGIDENTAAFYKFRACKSLAKLRKEMDEIERVIRESGFTPLKMDEILHTPTEELVNKMANVRHKESIHKHEKVFHKKKAKK